MIVLDTFNDMNSIYHSNAFESIQIQNSSKSSSRAPHFHSFCLMCSIHLNLFNHFFIIPSFLLFLSLLCRADISADTHENSGGKVHDKGENSYHERPTEFIVERLQGGGVHYDSDQTKNSWK